MRNISCVCRSVTLYAEKKKLQKNYENFLLPPVGSNYTTSPERFVAEEASLLDLSFISRSDGLSIGDIVGSLVLLSLLASLLLLLAVVELPSLPWPLSWPRDITHHDKENKGTRLYQKLIKMEWIPIYNAANPQIIATNGSKNQISGRDLIINVFTNNAAANIVPIREQTPSLYKLSEFNLFE